MWGYCKYNILNYKRKTEHRTEYQYSALSYDISPHRTVLLIFAINGRNVPEDPDISYKDSLLIRLPALYANLSVFSDYLGWGPDTPITPCHI
jgi:hypothetical protein